MNDKWDKRFLELAKHVATWSKDPSTQVGAVIVNDLKHVVGMGFNGFAAGVEDSEERYNDRPLKYKMVVHAEVNAILQAGHRARGGTIYVYPAFGSPPVCNDCAKVAIQAGIKCIVGYAAEHVDHILVDRWKESLKLSEQMFSEVGIEVKVVTV